jgi:hypothetical protein
MNRASGVHPRFHSSIYPLFPAVKLLDVSSPPSTTLALHLAPLISGLLPTAVNQINMD